LRFFKFYFFVSLLLSGVTVALPLIFLLPLVIKPLKHTNMEMDTVVTIVLSHNDTSKSGSERWRGRGTQTQILSPINHLVIKGKNR